MRSFRDRNARPGAGGSPERRPPHREGVRTLHNFTPDAAASLDGPEWLRLRRTDALDALATMPLPSEKEEVWRYTPIDQLDLDSYEPAPAPAAGTLSDPIGQAYVDGLVVDLRDRSALVVVRNGRPVAFDRSGLPDAVTVGGVEGEADLEAARGGKPRIGDVLSGGDALLRLNDAFVPDVVTVDVPARTQLAAPIVVVHWCDAAPAGEGGGPAPASFPRTVVRVGGGARASLVEVVAGPPGPGRSLVVPVTELLVDDGGWLDHVAVQVLGDGAWHVARLAGTAGRDAMLRTFTVGLGGAYDRSRTDAATVGAGASTELRSAYLGTGSQVHDVRTLQDHLAPHTTSDLLCKGAVAGTSRSVYSGLIRVRRGAVRAEAFQTNNNLVLDQRAHADSVPNLDIEENDVRCSHASTVGPVDEDQRYYLESRGIPPERAERLIVLGFFDDIVQRAPVPVAVPWLQREVGIRLGDALSMGAPPGGDHAGAADHG